MYKRLNYLDMSEAELLACEGDNVNRLLAYVLKRTTYADDGSYAEFDYDGTEYFIRRDELELYVKSYKPDGTYILVPARRYAQTNGDRVAYLLVGNNGLRFNTWNSVIDERLIAALFVEGAAEKLIVDRWTVNHKASTVTDEAVAEMKDIVNMYHAYQNERSKYTSDDIGDAAAKAWFSEVYGPVLYEKLSDMSNGFRRCPYTQRNNSIKNLEVCPVEANSAHRVITRNLRKVVPDIDKRIVSYKLTDKYRYRMISWNDLVKEVLKCDVI